MKEFDVITVVGNGEVSTERRADVCYKEFWEGE